MTPIGNSAHTSQNISVHTPIKKFEPPKCNGQFLNLDNFCGRFRWTRVLKYGSAAAHLLRFRLRTSTGHVRLSLVNSVCYQLEVSATSRSLVQRASTECVSLNVISWNNNHLHLQRVGRGGQTKEEERKEGKSGLPVRNTSLPVWIPARTGEKGKLTLWLCGDER